VVLSDKELIAHVRKLAPGGVDHVVEVAFGANIEADVELLRLGGSIASYATDNATPKIPYWQMVLPTATSFRRMGPTPVAMKAEIPPIYIWT
jgi:NADPH:quinone reductase